MGRRSEPVPSESQLATPPQPRPPAPSEWADGTSAVHAAPPHRVRDHLQPAPQALWPPLPIRSRSGYRRWRSSGFSPASYSPLRNITSRHPSPGRSQGDKDWNPIINIAPIALFAWLLQAADLLSPGPLSSPPTVSTSASESPSSSPSSINIYDDRGSRLGYATVHPDGSLDLYRPDALPTRMVNPRPDRHYP